MMMVLTTMTNMMTMMATIIVVIITIIIIVIVATIIIIIIASFACQRLAVCHLNARRGKPFLEELQRACRSKNYDHQEDDDDDEDDFPLRPLPRSSLPFLPQTTRKCA